VRRGQIQGSCATVYVGRHTSGTGFDKLALVLVDVVDFETSCLILVLLDVFAAHVWWEFRLDGPNAVAGMVVLIRSTTPAEISMLVENVRRMEIWPRITGKTFLATAGSKLFVPQETLEDLQFEVARIGDRFGCCQGG
jgi:hypothetical protein